MEGKDTKWRKKARDREEGNITVSEQQDR